MKPIKTKTQTTAKAASVANLARLNKLYSKFCRAHDNLMKEYGAACAEMNEKLCGKMRSARFASNQFNLLRKALPRTKFDMTSGKYFYAEENGQEVFAIKVSRELSCTVYVTAKDAEEAVKTATAVVEADAKLLEDKGLRAEDVSR